MRMDDVDDSKLTNNAEAAVADCEAEITAKYPSGLVLKIRTVGAFVRDGLKLDEACILSRIAPDTMKQLMVDDTNVAAFILIKQTQLKAGLLRTLAYKGIDNGDQKSAGYLLERLFPIEFGGQKGSQQPQSDNIVREAIDYIRSKGDNSPVVKTLPMKAVVVTPKEKDAATGSFTPQKPSFA